MSAFRLRRSVTAGPGNRAAFGRGGRRPREGQKVFTLQTLPAEPDASQPEVAVSRRHHTTHVIFEPEHFMARLATRVPKPRAHLTRYHGVFAPASPERARIVRRTHPGAANPTSPHGPASAADRPRNLSWAQRLKRVFAIDLDTCRQCGGRLLLSPDRRPRPAISRPISTRLDRFRC
jgi:hypothetical protein